MYGRRSISNSFTVITVDDPVGVVAQYAPNANPSASQIHDTWQEGDLYMRTRSTDSNVWSDWHRIVGSSAMYIHLKGTGQNNNQTALCEAFNGSTLDSRSITSRGITLIKILRSDLSISSVTTYDVYGDTVVYGESACANLASALNIITSDYFVCLVSYDAVRWTQELIDSLGNFGSIGLNDTTANRVPFAFIGYKGLPKGQAVQVQSGIGTTDAPAEITVYVKNSAIAVSKEPTVGRVGGRFYYNAGEYSYTSDVSFYVNEKEAPYFLYENDYWVFEPNVSSTTYYSMADMGYPSSQDSNWHLMVYNKQQFFMSEVMFARYAHLGSFIFNGDWQLSTNGEIDGTSYNNSANIGGTVITSSGTSSFSIKGYTLFDPLYPLGDTIVVTSGGSADKVIIGSQENTKTIATVYLRSDCVYKFKCKGRRYSDSYAVLVRLRSTDWSNGGWTPVYYPSTSDYETSTLTFRPQTSGYFYLEMYQPTLPSSSGVTAGGETSEWRLARVLFMPMLAFDGMTGKTYQSDAYIRGKIVATSGSINSINATNLNIKSGTITGDVTIGGDGVNIKLRPTGSGSNIGASIVAYDGAQTPFSLLFDRYSYGGTYYPHATLKLESVAPYSSKCGKIEIKDTESKRTLYYGSSQQPDYTYTLYEGFESITNFTGFVSKLSLNNAFHLRIGITRTGVSCIIADKMPTANDVSSIPTGCFYRDGNTIKIKT